MAGIEATKAAATSGEIIDPKLESDTKPKKDHLVPTIDDDRKTPKKRRKVNHGELPASYLPNPEPQHFLPFRLVLPPHHASSATRNTES